MRDVVGAVVGAMSSVDGMGCSSVGAGPGPQRPGLQHTVCRYNWGSPQTILSMLTEVFTGCMLYLHV